MAYVSIWHGWRSGSISITRTLRSMAASEAVVAAWQNMYGMAWHQSRRNIETALPVVTFCL